jgi:hypothetical protein
MMTNVSAKKRMMAIFAYPNVLQAYMLEKEDKLKAQRVDCLTRIGA